MNRIDIKNESKKKCQSRFCIIVVLIVLAFLFLILLVGLIIYLCVFARTANRKLVGANLTYSYNLTNFTNNTLITVNANLVALSFAKPVPQNIQSKLI